MKEQDGYDVARNLSDLFHENWQYYGFESLRGGNERHLFCLITERRGISHLNMKGGE